MAQSEMLTNFYNEYHDWVEAGATDHPIFHRGVGLCGSARWYARVNSKTGTLDTALAVEREIVHQLQQAGLCSSYPFGEIDYQTRFANDTMHECPTRMAWVKAHLEG